MNRSAIAIGVALAVGAVLLLPGALATTVDHSGTSERRSVVSDHASLPGALVVHPIPPGKLLELTVSLEPRNAGVLFALDRQLGRSGSAAYLSEAAFDRQFSPVTGNISALESYFSGFGGTGYSVTPDRLGLRFALPVGGAERAFATTLIGGSSIAGAAWTYTTSPTLPGPLAGSVYGIGGLSRAPVVPTLSIQPVRHGAVRQGIDSYVIDGNASGVDWFTGSDYVQAYGEAGLFPGGTGAGSNATFATGTAVATILMSGYNASSSTDLPPWDPAQIRDYFNDTFPAAWPAPSYVGVPVPSTTTPSTRPRIPSTSRWQEARRPGPWSRTSTSPRASSRP
ncbi:MAG: hypothetical protein L3J86_00730 [Thermoplasmata archaeon]|nr:hypothetical protein [Thermoplasmata archaeon]